MREEKFYSVRMRASKNGSHEVGGKHLSGGERLTTYENMIHTVNALLEKGIYHSRGKPDFMKIQFECIDEPIQLVNPLHIETHEVESAEKGQVLARKLLEKAGIQKKMIDLAYEQIPECSGLRGAILFDIHSGKRIDQRKERGVRVSRMDWPDTNFDKWTKCYQMPRNSRIKEALVLATKVSKHPATIAELCWSDDPDYITGYVASKKLGYQRITKLKEYGNEGGCRIFFVDGLRDLETYIDYLEKQPVFIQWEEENDA
ncbi:6-carboxyhexanoate--CoA ligase [Bacillus atrophaeus]|uniref:6-carboxyhexanoate--CoA ligase n=1 Tax=Bacillus atrophaeus TaxID=1452 RepID=UPI000D03E9E3|nr:6-carboxyhexanoate--CoA ligase [Bacillus atrophaeus]MCY8826586.1 6-carboxyhexanoate--CoA ligase [Bacillus atrophaeus]MCY8843126.1 6-carboxyhexanoate--CoA ligase [Bacillus atrophaeus]MEC0803765.1 6-carboxyhexanoate--CoA ligase [Bacillus atrophaeus]MEC0855599.1 6-carboxyhexanoate--CoA ligase [Bacillus atrophaeus]MEC0858649.1 6-carboxyhexanoate--CoA ligase [Bacillus atrophaeus]